VADLLRASRQEHWLDEAQLVVSELCTNAVLHARTPFEVTVQVHPDGVYVQVWDDEAAVPIRRVSDDGSTTGRGLELVEAMVTQHGVQTVGPTKVVWFCLGMSRPSSAEGMLLGRCRDQPDEAAAARAGDPRDVVLLAMPTALWMSAREHHNTLIREFALHTQAGQAAPEQAPVRLAAADRARNMILAALRAVDGRRSVDLRLQVWPAQAPWFHALLDVLDHAEGLASAGALLARPGPPAVVAVRRWACNQVLGQIGGAAPEAWTGPLELSV
jgi:Histidine kinase-like ATPase domain